MILISTCNEAELERLHFSPSHGDSTFSKKSIFRERKLEREKEISRLC